MSGYLIFGGIDSRDYDVFVSFSNIDTVPRRVYTKVDIVGKNGAVLIDEGKYEDVPHSYDCIVLDNEKRVAFVNAIMSKKGYQRLIDSYGTDEYYTAVLEENIEQKTTRIRDKFKFKLVFTRKPQRFLTSGEEPVDTSELGGEVTTDKIPYLFRRSGGGNIGHDFDAEIDKIIGGTVAWNQLVQNGNFADTSGWTSDRGTITASNNILSYQVTSVGAYEWDNTVQRSISMGTAKVLISFWIKPAHSKYIMLYNLGGNIGNNRRDVIGGQWNHIQLISSVSGEGYALQFGLNCTAQNGYSVGDIDQIKQVMVTSLTSLFGSVEIADYVYSLEQTTAGAGIAWLKSHGFLTKDYYAYNEGGLLSVKTSEHRTTGKNLFDKDNQNVFTGFIETGTHHFTESNRYKIAYIPCLPNTTYTISKEAGKTFRVADSSEIPADGVPYINTTANHTGTSITFTTASDARYLAVMYWSDANGDTKTADQIAETVQIEFGSTATDYEPYNAHSYPLDSGLELRGKFKLDANNNLYADGDVYESSGAVTRKYGFASINDFSTYSTGTSSKGLHYAETSLSNCKYISATTRVGIISNMLIEATPNDGWWDASTPTITALNGGKIRVYDNSASLSDFQTKYANLQIVYPLATPTTEQADPYASPQVVNPLGTEEYIDTRDVPVPVGHETKYGMSQLVLSNPTEFPSKPLLEVTGAGTFWLGDTLFTITGTAGQTIYIDCETGEAWKNTGGIITPANGLVTLNRLDFPELDPGDTPVMYGTGITKVVVTPRWWRL